MQRRYAYSFCAILMLGQAGCADTATIPVELGYGPDPVLPAPDRSLIPTVNIAKAIGWTDAAKPRAAPGLQVEAYARGLDHPRWLYVLPNGDVLVAESDAPPKPDGGRGLRHWIAKTLMARAGSGGNSANRITLLRDRDGDGRPEQRTVFLDGLNSPFGMALVGDQFFVANTDALLRFSYQQGATRLVGAGEKIVDLPAGPINHHWTKNVIARRDGTRLYVTSGSNSNIAENGMEAEENRAAILEVDPGNKTLRVFASGLRNPNGLAWQPDSGELWTTVNERDEIGSDLVPDYMTSVQDGGFYGWPYSYYGPHPDTRVKPQRPDLVAKALVPDYALGAHTASLGLAFYEGALLPERYRNGAFIGQHGSWNRKPHSGYKVVFVPFSNGQPSGEAEDILTGFLNDRQQAMGRPVGVAVDHTGALLVADDVGGVIWRVTPASHPGVR